MFYRDGQTFVWTAAHVVDGLRTERSVTDPKTGTTRKIVEFRDANVIKHIIEDGRTVGKTELNAEVIRYSDADTGEDIALLRMRKKDFIKDSVVFYLDPALPAVGTQLWHVGSLLGETGSNSVTQGIMSQHGRLINKTVFDQTTVTAFPGCLAGETEVYLSSGASKHIAKCQAGDRVHCFDTQPFISAHTWRQSERSNPNSPRKAANDANSESDSNLRPVVTGLVESAWSTGINPVYRISTPNRSVSATGNHPFACVDFVAAVDGQPCMIAAWRRADELKNGQEVVVMREPAKPLSDGGRMNWIQAELAVERIVSVEAAGKIETFDILVPEHHDFFANGFLVHNSSGGGVYLGDGRYIGTLVRGAGEGFNLIVPVRRMVIWAKSAKVYWAMDKNEPMAGEEELKKLPIEDIGRDFLRSDSTTTQRFPFLIERTGGHSGLEQR